MIIIKTMQDISYSWAHINYTWCKKESCWKTKTNFQIIQEEYFILKSNTSFLQCMNRDFTLKETIKHWGYDTCYWRLQVQAHCSLHSFSVCVYNKLHWFCLCYLLFVFPQAQELSNIYIDYFNLTSYYNRENKIVINAIE